MNRGDRQGPLQSSGMAEHQLSMVAGNVDRGFRGLVWCFQCRFEVNCDALIEFRVRFGMEGA